MVVLAVLERRVDRRCRRGRTAQQLRAVEDGVITIGARDLAFTQPCMVANAGEAFTIHLVNGDAMPHNVAVYNDSTKANEIMRGEISPVRARSTTTSKRWMRASTTSTAPCTRPT